jgi:hypothetical protein
MKSILISALLVLGAHAGAIAQTAELPVGDSFDIERQPYGSGTPAAGVSAGVDEARHVADGLYHVPNYLPGFPTAATIWPRELPVECRTDVFGSVTCKGYEVLPAVGRGEYIFVRPYVKPVAKAQPAPEPKREAPKPPVVYKKPLG